jgi:hypothetical protein
MSTLPQPNTAHNPQARAIPVYLRGTSKPIGRVSGPWFEKTISGSVHFLRVPMLALGFDVSTLEDAAAAGAVAVAVTDSETGHIYRQRIETILKYGFDVRRGFGRQVALPLTAYAIDGKPPAVPPGEPVTNAERKDAQLSLFGGA